MGGAGAARRAGAVTYGRGRGKGGLRASEALVGRRESLSPQESAGGESEEEVTEEEEVKGKVEEGGPELAKFWREERRFWDQVDEVELEEEEDPGSGGG